MEDLQKAALLLKHLSVAERTQILSQLNDDQRIALEQQIETVTEVSQAELVGIVAEYQNWLRQLKSDQTQDETIEPVADVSYLTDSRDLVRLTQLLAVEPATIQAAVLCHIEEQTAQELFHSFTEEQQAELIERLPAQQALSPLVWDDLSLCLHESSTTETTSHKRGQQLLTRLVSHDEVGVVSEGQLGPGEQALVERLKK